MLKSKQLISRVSIGALLLALLILLAARGCTSKPILIGPQGDVAETKIGGMRKTSTPGGLAVCLSGGGYRAMLYHAGVLLALNDARKLDDLRAVAGVSGGSITAATLALHWDSLTFEPDGYASNLRAEVIDPILHLSGETIDRPAIVLSMARSQTGSAALARAYDKYLFGDATLSSIPPPSPGIRPRFLFLATNVATQKPFYFSQDFIGAYGIHARHPGDLRLSQAVAASSAFPPFLAPMWIDISKATRVDDAKLEFYNPGQPLLFMKAREQEWSKPEPASTSWTETDEQSLVNAIRRGDRALVTRLTARKAELESSEHGYRKALEDWAATTDFDQVVRQALWQVHAQSAEAFEKRYKGLVQLIDGGVAGNLGVSGCRGDEATTEIVVSDAAAVVDPSPTDGDGWIDTAGSVMDMIYERAEGADRERLMFRSFCGPQVKDWRSGEPDIPYAFVSLRNFRATEEWARRRQALLDRLLAVDPDHITPEIRAREAGVQKLAASIKEMIRRGSIPTRLRRVDRAIAEDIVNLGYLQAIPAIDADMTCKASSQSRLPEAFDVERHYPLAVTLPFAVRSTETRSQNAGTGAEVR